MIGYVCICFYPAVRATLFSPWEIEVLKRQAGRYFCRQLKTHALGSKNSGFDGMEVSLTVGKMIKKRMCAYLVTS
ncbi:MAG: hypothetical protein ACE5FU_11685 [Nitrospinota bacterium]